MRIIFLYNVFVNGWVDNKNVNCRSGFKVYMQRVNGIDEERQMMQREKKDCLI